jgi:hypothetical protein
VNAVKVLFSIVYYNRPEQDYSRHSMSECWGERARLADGKGIRCSFSLLKFGLFRMRSSDIFIQDS